MNYIIFVWASFWIGLAAIVTLRDRRINKLRNHWLSGLTCDHDNKTDIAHCYCGWNGTLQPNVGSAVAQWAEHVSSQIEFCRWW